MSKNVYLDPGEISVRSLNAALNKLEKARDKLAKVKDLDEVGYVAPDGAHPLFVEDQRVQLKKLYLTTCRIYGRLENLKALLETGTESLAEIDNASKNDLTTWWERGAFSLWRENSFGNMTSGLGALFLSNVHNTGSETNLTPSIKIVQTGEREEISSTVFDENGMYGGDQSGPGEETDPEKKEAYYNVIRTNLPDEVWTEDKLEEYLESISANGCVFTAYANIIMQYFEGREDEFEKIFGYPMRTEDGTLDFNMLIVDICSSQESLVDGVNVFEMRFRLDDFLEDHGIEVENRVHIGQYIVNTLPFSSGGSGVVTAENYQALTESGKYIIVQAKGTNLISADGTDTKTTTCHGMVVTGVTSDGRFIVSSWGKKYYIEPNSGTLNFWTVEFQ